MVSDRSQNSSGGNIENLYFLIVVLPMIQYIPQDLWLSIVQYGICGITELSSFSLVSKRFRILFFQEKWISVITSRNFIRSFRQFLSPIHHNEESLQDYVITKTLSLFSRFKYCVSGAFALAVILGQNITETPWGLTVVDIYISISRQDFSRQRFRDQIKGWWNDVNRFIRCKMGNIIFGRPHRLRQWIPTITENHHILAMVIFDIVGHEDKDTRSFRFFVLNSRFHATPHEFCESKSAFTFLSNSISVDDSGACWTQIGYPTSIINKSGPYSTWFLSEWELEWVLWQKQRDHSLEEVRRDYIERRKLIPSVREERLTQINRGFTVTGFIPRAKFSFYKKAFL